MAKKKSAKKAARKPATTKKKTRRAPVSTKASASVGRASHATTSARLAEAKRKRPAKPRRSSKTGGGKKKTTSKKSSRKPSRRSKPATRLAQLTKELIERYECGPVRFSGKDDALFEEHLVFDHVIEPREAEPRDQFEAIANSLRDILAQRWIKTRKTYDRENPKRVYYLSMEFLIGRSLSNNITNMMVEPVVTEAMAAKGIDWLEAAEQEPDAGLGNGGLGRLAACFIESMATLQIPAIGYGLRYEHGIFRQSIANG